MVSTGIVPHLQLVRYYALRNVDNKENEKEEGAIYGPGIAD